ncbi:MAG: hypothetical protein R6U11_00575 [Bacteroidales bacterium]
MKKIISIIIVLLSIFTGCEKNNEKGDILFCTNSNIINCPFSIEISIDDRIVGTLNAGSDFNSTNCSCPSNENIGILFNIETGNHTYSAVEIECAGSNRVNSWSGNLKVEKDECKVIFLDVNE